MSEGNVLASTWSLAVGGAADGPRRAHVVVVQGRRRPEGAMLQKVAERARVERPLDGGDGVLSDAFDIVLRHLSAQSPFEVHAGMPLPAHYLGAPKVNFLDLTRNYTFDEVLRKQPTLARWCFSSESVVYNALLCCERLHYMLLQNVKDLPSSVTDVPTVRSSYNWNQNLLQVLNVRAAALATFHKYRHGATEFSQANYERWYGVALWGILRTVNIVTDALFLLASVSRAHVDTLNEFLKNMLLEDVRMRDSPAGLAFAMSSGFLLEEIVLRAERVLGATAQNRGHYEFFDSPTVEGLPLEQYVAAHAKVRLSEDGEIPHHKEVKFKKPGERSQKNNYHAHDTPLDDMRRLNERMRKFQWPQPMGQHNHKHKKKFEDNPYFPRPYGNHANNHANKKQGRGKQQRLPPGPRRPPKGSAAASFWDPGHGMLLEASVRLQKRHALGLACSEMRADSEHREHVVRHFARAVQLLGGLSFETGAVHDLPQPTGPRPVLAVVRGLLGADGDEHEAGTGRWSDAGDDEEHLMFPEEPKEDSGAAPLSREEKLREKRRLRNRLRREKKKKAQQAEQQEEDQWPSVVVKKGKRQQTQGKPAQAEPRAAPKKRTLVPGEHDDSENRGARQKPVRSKKLPGSNRQPPGGGSNHVHGGGGRGESDEWKTAPGPKKKQQAPAAAGNPPARRRLVPGEYDPRAPRPPPRPATRNPPPGPAIVPHRRGTRGGPVPQYPKYPTPLYPHGRRLPRLVPRPDFPPPPPPRAVVAPPKPGQPGYRTVQPNGREAVVGITPTTWADLVRQHVQPSHWGLTQNSYETANLEVTNEAVRAIESEDTGEAPRAPIPVHPEAVLSQGGESVVENVWKKKQAEKQQQGSGEGDEKGGEKAEPKNPWKKGDGEPAAGGAPPGESGIEKLEPKNRRRGRQEGGGAARVQQKPRAQERKEKPAPIYIAPPQSEEHRRMLLQRTEVDLKRKIEEWTQKHDLPRSAVLSEDVLRACKESLSILKTWLQMSIEVMPLDQFEERVRMSTFRWNPFFMRYDDSDGDKPLLFDYNNARWPGLQQEQRNKVSSNMIVGFLRYSIENTLKLLAELQPKSTISRAFVVSILNTIGASPSAYSRWRQFESASPLVKRVVGSGGSSSVDRFKDVRGGNDQQHMDLLVMFAVSSLTCIAVQDSMQYVLFSDHVTPSEARIANELAQHRILTGESQFVWTFKSWLTVAWSRAFQDNRKTFVVEHGITQEMMVRLGLEDFTIDFASGLFPELLQRRREKLMQSSPGPYTTLHKTVSSLHEARMRRLLLQAESDVVPGGVVFDGRLVSTLRVVGQDEIEAAQAQSDSMVKRLVDREKSVDAARDDDESEEDDDDKKGNDEESGGSGAA